MIYVQVIVSTLTPCPATILISLQRYMLSADPEHEQLFDLIQQLLIYDPRKRLASSEALKHSFFSPYVRSAPHPAHTSTQSKRSLSSQSSSSSETE